MNHRFSHKAGAKAGLEILFRQELADDDDFSGAFFAATPVQVRANHGMNVPQIVHPLALNCFLFPPTFSSDLDPESNLGL